MQDVSAAAASIRASIETAVKGKPEVIELAVTSLLAGGHVLVEDVPGVGKTSLARAIAATVEATWSRIQFTPDLLPSDVTGGDVFHEQTNSFEFHAGPIFSHIVVADEINRASPKTQSALLEVMEEQSVTVGGTTHPVPTPFLVLATQNPVEMDGTYRLPEAQLDRFLMKLSMGYPSLTAETEILSADGSNATIRHLEAATTTEALAALIEAVSAVTVAEPLARYIATVAAETRKLSEVRLGVSPRGGLALMRAARARAAMHGRDYATADDVKALAVPVLAHRLLLSPQATLAKVSQRELIERVLASVPVPTNG